MTFNIRNGKAKDGPNHWDLRCELVFDVLRDHKPDVVGLQEVRKSQLTQLKEAFPKYNALGVTRNAGNRGGEAVNILYDRSRLESLDSGTFWFSETPEVPGSKSWGSSLPRICTWSRFRDRRANTTFYLYNVHFDYKSAQARENSTELLAYRISEREFPDDPVIVTGDLNTGTMTAPIRYLLGKLKRPQTKSADAADRPLPPTMNLQDGFRLRNPKMRRGGTFHRFSGRRTAYRIDWILTSPEFTVETSELILDNDNGRYPSDHFPVTTRLRR